MAPQLAAVGLVASDMAATLAFYRRLGLSIPATADHEAHVEVELPGGLKLLIDTVDVVLAFDSSWTPPAGSPASSLAFQCADPADVDRVYADLVAAGHTGHQEPWNAFWGQRYAVVRDPDGRAVNLFAPVPT